jgi:hypothetical protein
LAIEEGEEEVEGSGSSAPDARVRIIVIYQGPVPELIETQI